MWLTMEIDGAKNLFTTLNVKGADKRCDYNEILRIYLSPTLLCIPNRAQKEEN